MGVLSLPSVGQVVQILYVVNACDRVIVNTSNAKLNTTAYGIDAT